jgi:hypothetical protein
MCFSFASFVVDAWIVYRQKLLATDKMTGINMLHVPYQGGGPGNDLGSRFSSSRFAACLPTALRWNDAVSIGPHKRLMHPVHLRRHQDTTAQVIR